MHPEVSRAWEHSYRDKWRWERSAWGSHCVDCYPGNCTFRVYVRDGKVLREEQAGTFPVIEAGVPDMNPMGCRNGAAWSTQLYAAERLLHPLKRKGSRGGGTWERISWDQALTEIADAIIDAIGEVGPGAILGDGTPEPIASLGRRLIALLGGTVLDPVGEVGDFSAGVYLTFGKFFTSSVDDWFHSDLILIWHRNPAYTQIPWCHFVTEARYKGAEVVTIAPDYNASAIHADTFVPVEAGSDAALALAMCAVVIEEGLWDAAFVKEQTDLALLVRKDNRRFLRASDLEEGGSDQQFYLLDSRTDQLAAAPRGTLSLADVDPALSGSCTVTVRDGQIVEVVPAMELLVERLRDYIPEMASKTCGVHPEVIRTLARGVAKKRTNILLGWNAAKYYHGDLMERSMSLLLGLTGNWGKRGTGIRSWVVAPAEGLMVPQAMIAGLDDADALLTMQRDALDAVSAMDPSLSREMAAIEVMNSAAAIGGMIPPSSSGITTAAFARSGTGGSGRTRACIRRSTTISVRRWKRAGGRRPNR